jgi:hypothetical protein
MCDLVVPFLTSGTFLDPCVVQIFPLPPVPFTLRRRFIPSCSSALPEPVASSRLPDLSAGSCFPWFCAPLTTTPELAPYEMECQLHFGSALRFFQPLSGFVANSSFVALFRATTVWGSPFRVFPSQESRTSFKAAFAPFGYLPTCRNAPVQALLPPVSPTSMSENTVAWLLRRLKVPFPHTEVCFPVALGSIERSHLVSACFTRFEAFSSCESVRTAPSCPETTVVTLLSFASLELSPSTPWIL